jgi:hypothetical protein
MTSALPGTFTRPQYPPPVPVGFNADVGGATPVEHALRVQQAVHDQYSQWRAAHSPDIAPDVLQTNAGMYSVSDGALALPDALAGSKAAADQAAQNLTNLFDGVRVPEDDVASQLAAQAYWSRKYKVLESVRDSAKLLDSVQSLIASASPQELAVLWRELPDYLLSRGVKSSDWLQSAIAERIPGFKEAAEAKTLAARQHAVIAQNHANLTKSILSDTPPAPLLDPYSPLINSKPYDGGTSTPYTNGG